MNKKLFNTLSKEELVARLNEHPQDYVTISFYKYHRIDNPEWFRDYLFLHLNEMGVLGRIYIAQEGINAQITVPSAAIEQFRTFLYSISFLDQLRLNYAIEEHGNSFLKLKIKIRNKIVADGIDDPTFDPSDCGVHLDANAFNKIIEDPNTILIDMRNHYESEVGHFKGAITPDVVTFRESLPIIAEQFKDKTERPDRLAHQLRQPRPCRRRFWKLHGPGHGNCPRSAERIDPWPPTRVRGVLVRAG